jgi:hypothetical protein
MSMLFPYERYESLAEPMRVFYPTGEEAQARWVSQTIDNAGKLLISLLNQPMPGMEILLVSSADWGAAPPEDFCSAGDDGLNKPLPYWADATHSSYIVIPTELDPIVGEPTQEKLAFLLYHELTRAFLENDPRPWPDEYPLWADEWQLQFAATWLSQQINGQQGIVTRDLHQKYAEIFEPEEDGKTPITVRGFDWYDDTSPEDYLCFDLLLEQFAADLLKHYGPEVLPCFLALYRKDHRVLLSDDVTEMLGSVLGPGGIEWLEGLVYF